MMWRLYLANDNCCQHLQIFSEILVMPMKLQFAVSRAALVFRKKIQMLVAAKEGEI